MSDNQNLKINAKYSLSHSNAQLLNEEENKF
jgi:hypothetical protein